MESGTNWGSTKRRLERRNMVKHYAYNASSPLHSPNDCSSSASALLHTRLLDLFEQTKFWVKGGEGEIDRICWNLGLSGIDDFAILIAAREVRKIRLSFDLLLRSRLNWMESSRKEAKRRRLRHRGLNLGCHGECHEGEDEGHHGHVRKLHGRHCHELELEDIDNKVTI
ncbi:hypothetical protein NL676_020784 [Syzygium grande]|nr:hypothetical protein NL676_020784 [Syzygium grande]